MFNKPMVQSDNGNTLLREPAKKMQYTAITCAINDRDSASTKHLAKKQKPILIGKDARKLLVKYFFMMVLMFVFASVAYPQDKEKILFDKSCSRAIPIKI